MTGGPAGVDAATARLALVASLGLFAVGIFLISYPGLHEVTPFVVGAGGQLVTDVSLFFGGGGLSGEVVFFIGSFGELKSITS